MNEEGSTDGRKEILKEMCKPSGAQGKDRLPKEFTRLFPYFPLAG